MIVRHAWRFSYPGDLAARQLATHDNNRFADLFSAFSAQGVEVEPAVYDDDFCAQVREQLLRVDAVLVWVNPLDSHSHGHGSDQDSDQGNRLLLDAMLRDVAAAGVFVSTHPDVISKLGTKQVLVSTQDLGCGCDTHLYTRMQQMRQQLPARLAAGQARVLKQFRGNGGDGVWKVQLPMKVLAPGDAIALPHAQSIVLVRHAKRGCVEQAITLAAFFDLCEPYFAASGKMIDQQYQDRLPEGMIRCYLVHDKVLGFGHQAINALFPAPVGAAPSEAPLPGPRLYHPPTQAEFQTLKNTLEQQWLPAMQQRLDLETTSLPILWDCDFLLGAKNANGEDSYVLCEINVSSVAPYPESAVSSIVAATRLRAQASRRMRGLAS